MGKIKISYIEEKDLDLIYRLYKHFAFYEWLEDYHTASSKEIYKMVFEEKLLHILKAEIDGEIVGFCTYYFQIATFPMKKVMYVEDIYIRSAFRGQGIGTKLFDACEKVAKVHDCCKLKWECLEWNKEAQHFYKHIIGGKKVTKWRTYTKDLLSDPEDNSRNNSVDASVNKGVAEKTEPSE